MAFTIEYRAAGAELIFSGKVTGDEILQAKEQFFAHEFEGEARYVICDFTAGETFDVSTESVEAIVQQDKAAMKDHPVLLEAVVAPRPLVYGLSRMWQMKVDTIRPHTAVTETRAEALRWLSDAGLTELVHGRDAAN